MKKFSLFTKIKFHIYIAVNHNLPTGKFYTEVQNYVLNDIFFLNLEYYYCFWQAK